MSVLIQAGHYPSGGGAPGEAAWCYDLAHRIAARLELAGVTVAVIGDFLNKPVPPQMYQDWDLFLALHYDAPILRNGVWDTSGCFADRAPLDPSGAAADRFIALWEPLYSLATGIGLDRYRGEGNPNTDRYYAFNATTAATPGVLLEHGCGSPVPKDGYPAGSDAPFLHGSIDIVADADASAILAFLGIGANDVTPEQQRILDACARHGLFSDGDVDWLAGTWNDLAAQVDSLGTLLGAAQDERDAAAQDAAALQAEVETLEAKLAEPPPTTPAPRVSGVTVEFSDGTLFAARDL